MLKNNKVKFVEAMNGYRIRIKETKKVNAKYIMTLQDANYNKIKELRCAAKDYNNTLATLIELAEKEENEGEELIYEAEINVNDKKVKKVMNKLDKDIKKLEKEVKKEKVRKVEKDMKKEEVKKVEKEIELPILEEDEGVEYNFQFEMPKDEVIVIPPERIEVAEEPEVEEEVIEEPEVVEEVIEEPEKEEKKNYEPKVEVKVEKKENVIVKAAKKVGKAIVKTAKKVGKATVKAAKAVAKTAANIAIAAVVVEAVKAPFKAIAKLFNRR